MFNILGSVDGMHVLDLFSGSGLLALEAVSRGAAHVVSVERHRHIANHLRDVCDSWQLHDRWKIMPASVHEALSRLSQQHFELIMADPPYEQGLSEMIPSWLDEFAIGCGRLVIEESARVHPNWPESWTTAPPRRYGDTSLHFLERS